MAAVFRWLRRNVDEIGADPVLRIYGALLALTHVLTFLHWKLEMPMERILGGGGIPICWPFFESCAEHRFLGAAAVRLLLWLYLAGAVAGALLFASRRLAALAWAGLLALTLFKALIWLQDYRLRLNQHYMALFATLVFLLLPAKRRLLRYQIVLFYFWAGALKLDREWLSGAGLYARPWLVPAALVPAACVYVVGLEMALVWGLLARRAWLFWATLAQLLLFHVTSFTVVGFFYPTLMFCLLAIYPLARLLPRAEGGPPLAGWIYLAAFSLLQVLPWLFPGDTAITGEGRIFALHMFDARVVCEAKAMLHFEGQEPIERWVSPNLPTRMQCDPLVYLSVGRGLCRRFRAQPGFVDLDLSLRSRRTSEAELRPVMDVRRFCTTDLSYDLWRPNLWIRPSD